MRRILAAAMVAASLVSVSMVSATGVAQAASEHRTLKPGAHGADVKKVQKELKALHYDPGAVDGKYGHDMQYAVWAFRKVNHLKPNSTVGWKFWRALAHPVTPKPLIRKGAKNRAEVDIKHQLLFVYRKGKLKLISHISSGSGNYYTVGGHTERAVTPTGNFHIQRFIKGWHQSALGYLYNPLYFTGGYAIHGETSVPLHPASHGCVRIPMHTATLTPKLIPIGTAVYVRR